MGQIITPDKSIVNVNGAIQLDGDSASPGNSKLYGTNVSGDRGWYDQPTGSASYPYGLGTSLAADADHDVTIAAGAIPSSDGSTLLTLPSAMTKRIDATWAVGTTNGGLFSGSVASSTTYHLFVIQKTSDGSIDAGWDTSLTAANIPAGYGKYRRVASYVTNSSANLRLYTHTGRVFEYSVPVTDVSAETSVPSTLTAVGVSVPGGLRMKWRGLGILDNSNAGSGLVIVSGDCTDGSIAAAAYSNTEFNAGNLELITNTSSQVKWKLATGTHSAYLVTRGYEDVDF